MEERYSYRVNKYESNLPGGNEWISFYDIGSLVTKEDYLYTENEFIQLVIDLSMSHKILQYTITDLENHNKLYYHDGDCILCKDLEPLIRDLLREKVWCKLHSNELEFHFGYDYYMYVVSYGSPIRMEAINSPLKIEEFESPYLD